ncbi:MAG: tRNA (adenosine(37)-N6)-threonylcarbamoyltransferase complex dimerization subunit type 1 TsaB [Chlamydiia bacterium]|nr:tRNA (adenosine(37)-N6)-threonylcarbamoyltransferase complex dimerization subunit type 1 TsaB [Chlamydiia bacterium]
MHLVIDTSSEKGIAMVYSDQAILSVKHFHVGKGAKEELVDVVRALLEELNASSRDLKTLFAGMGPGSYTGIRVGVMFAKALGFALGIPFKGFCSLGALVPSIDEGRFAGLIDARSGGVYLQLGERRGHRVLREDAPCRMKLEEAIDLLKGVPHLVATRTDRLMERFEEVTPSSVWSWEETQPDPTTLHQLCLLAAEGSNGLQEILYL